MLRYISRECPSPCGTPRQEPASPDGTDLTDGQVFEFKSAVFMSRVPVLRVRYLPGGGTPGATGSQSKPLDVDVIVSKAPPKPSPEGKDNEEVTNVSA